MTKEYRIVLLNIIICCVFFACGLFIANHVHAQTSAPGLPFQLYGKVTTSNGSIVSGASIEAEIKGVIVAKSVTNASGNYGFAPNLLIIPDPEGAFAGGTVTLSVNGSPVQQTAAFDPGALKDLDLISTKPSVDSVITKSTDNDLVQLDSPKNSVQAASSFDESRSAQSGPTAEEVNYRTPIFHLKKHQSTVAYEKEQENTLKYRHSKFLGTISLVLIIIILSWVYLQNYLHKRKQARKRLHF